MLVEKLSFNYGKLEILKNLDLNIQDGEFMVLGPSGCGKTTLLNCIAGLLDLNEGQIWIENDNVTWKEPKKTDISEWISVICIIPQHDCRKPFFWIKNDEC